MLASGTKRRLASRAFFPGALIAGCGLALLSAVLTCCGPASAASASKAASGGTLTIGSTFASVNFDPWEAPNGDNETVEYNSALYDSLLVLRNNQPAPSVATSWKFTSPTTFVLHLRSGIRFDDGTPLDASAVKANFDYAQSASPAGSYDQQLQGVQTTVVSPTTVKLTLPSPDPDLPYVLATGGGYMVDPAALADPSKLTTTPEGSGPYTLVPSETVANEQYVFARRSSQWNLANYPYQKVVIKIFSSTQSQLDALRSGQINFADVLPTDLPTIRSAGLRVENGALESIAGLWINDRTGTLVKALGKLGVRQALNYAVNRTAITKVSTDGLGSPGSLLTPPGTTGYTAAAAKFYRYDPAKARRLLAKAGYPHGFTLPILSTQAGDTIVQAIAGYLRAVGITPQISDHSTDFVTQAFSGKWATMVFTWGMTPPFTSLNELLAPDGSGNPNHSKNAQIDALLTQMQTTTGAAQVRVMQKLVATVNQQGWFLITQYSRGYAATSASVTCSGPEGCPLYTFRPAR